MRLTEKQNRKQANISTLKAMREEYEAILKNSDTLDIGLDKRFEYDLKIMVLTDALETFGAIEALQQENAALKTELESYQRGIVAINEAIEIYGCYKP